MTVLNQLPRLAEPTRVLQVFNKGRPCGWLGEAKDHLWFHYASGSTEQAPVSLLMPASQTHYSWPRMFPAFEQHLPSKDGRKALQALYPKRLLSDLDLLGLVGSNTWGTLSFSNPDSPYAQSRLHITQDALSQLEPHTLGTLAPGVLSTLDAQGYRQLFCALETGHGITASVVHRKGAGVHRHTLLRVLLEVRQTANPRRQTPALGWLDSVREELHCLHHRRQDTNILGQGRMATESLHSALGLNRDGMNQLLGDPKRFRRAVHEVIWTFCRLPAVECRMFDALLPMLLRQELELMLLSDWGQSPTAQNPSCWCDYRLP